jgi:hypothetical protein
MNRAHSTPLLPLELLYSIILANITTYGDVIAAIFARAKGPVGSVPYVVDEGLL